MMVLIKSKSDEWWTPDDLFKEICEMVKIKPECDYAATKENRKCEFFMDDSLNSEWVYDGWLNPPNSMTKQFMDKALDEWTSNNINIICLIPSACISRRYFQPIWQTFHISHDLIDIIPIPRPDFWFEGKKEKGSARNDTVELDSQVA